MGTKKPGKKPESAVNSLEELISQAGGAGIAVEILPVEVRAFLPKSVPFNLSHEQLGLAYRKATLIKRHFSKAEIAENIERCPISLPEEIEEWEALQELQDLNRSFMKKD